MDKELAIRIVSRMSFSASEYLQNPQALVEEAISHYASVEECSTDIRDEMSQILAGSYRERMLLSVTCTDLPDRMFDGVTFRIYINDCIVEGLLHLTPKKISIEYGGHIASSELKLLAPVIWTVSPYQGSEANDDGRMKSIALLTELYYSSLRKKL